jgi:hypothetical protein
MYWFDTSAFLHGWKRDYPPDVFASLWLNLDKLISSSRLFAPDEVLYELERGGDDIFAWAKQRKFVFQAPEAAVQEIVSRIVEEHPSFVPETSHDGVWADPWVIAFAIHTNGRVVTGEKPTGPGAKILKIPNICGHYGINYLSLLDVIRLEDWKFLTGSLIVS